MTSDPGPAIFDEDGRIDNDFIAEIRKSAKGKTSPVIGITGTGGNVQAEGVEVIHLGHNRSVDEIVTAAIDEDADAIAVSSYQGGHLEFFKYMIDLLKKRGAEHIKIFGGGGGVIISREVQELREYGMTPPPPACSTAMTPPSTYCAAFSRPKASKSFTSAITARSTKS